MKGLSSKLLNICLKLNRLKAILRDRNFDRSLCTKVSNIFNHPSKYESVRRRFSVNSQLLKSLILWDYLKYRWRKENNGWRWMHANSFEVTLSLIFAGCLAIDLNDKRLLRAAQYGNVSEIKKLVSEGVDMNLRHPLGWTALHVASINNRVGVVVALLKAGADPNLGDNFINIQRTAIEKGMHSLDVLMVREEEFSDRLNSRATFQGFTALHYAVLADNVEMIQALLDGGANPIKENDAGHRPVDYAKEGEVKNLLLKHSVKFEELLKKKEADERRRFPIEQRLKQYIVGQEGPIAIVASAPFDIPAPCPSFSFRRAF